jgi:flagellar protein FliS
MNPYDKYKKNSITTATPAKLVLMLYEGAIKYLKFSLDFIDKKDLPNSNNNLIRAQKIIQELIYSLDMEKGKDLSSNLFKLYDYMVYQLIQANIKKDKNKINEVINMLEELKKSWEEMMKKLGMSTITNLSIKPVLSSESDFVKNNSKKDDNIKPNDLKTPYQNSNINKDSNPTGTYSKSTFNIPGKLGGLNIRLNPNIKLNIPKKKDDDDKKE